MRILSLTVFFVFLLVSAKAQDIDSVETDSRTEIPDPFAGPWFKRINLRGYGQIRYNTLQSNRDLTCEQCDQSWGGVDEFFLRRARIVLSGQISKRVYLYFQIDFASAISSSSIHTAQLRDLYADIGLDNKSEFRLRLGQAKIPFGYENMQSSSARLPLDRADGLNSAFKNERDLGGFFYWLPEEKKRLFAYMKLNGLKHSGDFGMLGLGIFNGQTANSGELNNNKHVVGRFSYPMRVGTQVIEPGIQAYTGKYQLSQGQVSPGVGVKHDRNYIDERIAASFVLSPQPFGIQAEYNVGRGPEYSPALDSVTVQSLHGGYVIFSYFQKVGSQLLIPFTRLQYYDGGKKHELDARSYNMRELELGVEWHPLVPLELVVMYTFSSRRYEDHVRPDNLQKGNLLRLQAQFVF